MKITFLSGSVPLAKTISLVDGVVEKSGYPNLKLMTSHEYTVNSIREFYTTLINHGSKGQCLLKGVLKKPLVNASRKGQMPPNTPTQWICFDLDKAPFTSPDEFMRSIKLDDVSYVAQYSASYKVNKKDKTLSCHIFVLLNETMAPSQLKTWLMYLNLHTPILEASISLSKSKVSLHWPLDITVCQNDKLIYTSTPTFVGMPDPFPKDRTSLHPGKTHTLDVSRIALKPLDTLKKEAKKKLNTLREAQGLEPNNKKNKVVGEYTIQPGASAASKWEQFEEEDYYRYNLEDGDSKAYWHPKNNYEYLHSFKGEDSMLMSEILPDVYKQFKAQERVQLESETEQGDYLLAYREKRSGKYWKGTWNPSTLTLDIHEVDALVKLDHFLQSRGSALGPFVPEYTMVFDPQSEVIYDRDAKQINTFIPTPLMRENAPGKYPIIQRVLDSAVGIGEVQEQFLNWLACILQHRVKTQIGWVLHGTYGTGKGLILNAIMKPILQEYAEQILAPTLSEKFNGWREQKLLIMVDEIEVDLFEDKVVEAKLRNWVTEPTQDIRKMNTNMYKNPCFNNWMFGSNKPQPVGIPRKDRRYNVGQYQNERFKTTRREVEIELPKELPAFAHYLMHRKADIDMAGSIFDSEDRRQIQELSITSIDELSEDILSGRIEKLWQYMPDEKVLNDISNPTAALYADMIKEFTNETISKISRDQLGILYKHCIGAIPEGANKFTSFLRHHGIRTKKMRINNATNYGIEIEWKIDAKTRTDLLQSLTQTHRAIRRIK